MEAAEDWSDRYKILVEYHDSAYKYIDEAIKLTNQDKFNEAVAQYHHGLEMIDKALEINVECPRNPDFTFEKACSMVQKMKKIRKEILGQIAECQSKTYSWEHMNAPPSYEEAVSSSLSSSSCTSDSTNNTFDNPSNSNSLTYAELGNMLENLKININAQSVQNLFTCDNVIIYHISTDGSVTATMEPDVLRVFQLEDGQIGNASKYYLQIGTYLYPLVRNVSPCYRADYGAIFLPNVESGIEGDVIGLIVPQDREDALILLLQGILNIKLKADESTSPAVSTKISDFITSKANALSNCLVNGAHRAEQFLDSNTPKLIDKINPSSKQAAVSPKVVKGVKVAKNVTAKTADITAFVATKVGTATLSLGKYLAPHIKKGGTKLLGVAGCSQSEASRKVDDIFVVAAGALEGFSTIYKSLEVSATVLGNSLASNTVEVVTHKYGGSVGKVTEDTFHTVGNSLQIANNVRIFKPNNIIKSTASGAFTNSGEDSKERFVNNVGESSNSDTKKNKSENGLSEGNSSRISNGDRNCATEPSCSSKQENITCSSQDDKQDKMV